MKGGFFMLYGYARVSTKEQNLERQLEQLREYVKDERNIKRDKQSGKDFDRREYNALVGTEETAPLLREGDMLIVCSLDRFGRNYTEIRREWEYITKVLKVDIKVLDMPLLDTSTKNDNLDGCFISDLVLQILSYVAEKERINSKNRQSQGYAVMPVVNGKKVSLKTGKPVGRPNAIYPESWETVYNTWKSGEITAITAMKQLELTKTTFYKLVKLYEKKA